MAPPVPGALRHPRRRRDVDGSAGVEPAASAFAGLRSCPLSYDPILVLRAGVAPARPGFQAGALLLSYRSRGWSRRKESNLTSQRRAVYSRQAVPAASPGRWWTCRELNSHRAGASRASLPRDKPKLVLTGGVEPPRPRGHRLLKTACLPVPSGEQDWQLARPHDASSWGGSVSAECAELSLEHPRGYDPRPTRWKRVMLPSTPRMQDGAARGRRSRYLRLGKPMLCQRELAPQDGAGRTNRTLSSRVGAELVTMTCPTRLRGPAQPVRKEPLPR